MKVKEGNRAIYLFEGGLLKEGVNAIGNRYLLDWNGKQKGLDLLN